jgi:putative ABC transport system ATP-binding protein
MNLEEYEMSKPNNDKKRGDASIVRLVDISKDFGRSENTVHALKDINFELRKGEFVVILGPSGSGKTTLLNVASTLEKPTSGSVYYNNTESSGMSKNKLTALRRDHIGFIFQAYHLLPNLNVQENVLVGASLSGEKKKVPQILRDVGLQEKMKKFPYQLSGGEQQRVSIARALAKNTDILFCDEPTGALDTETNKVILALLLKVQKEKDLSIVLVTHNPQIALIANRVLRMRDGRVVSDEWNTEPRNVEEVDWLQ